MPAYDRTSIWLHWILGLAILGQFALGWWMADLPKEPAAARAGWLGLHKVVGITLAALVVIRLAWRATHPAPPLPGTLPRLQRALARATHWALYACMLVMPASGYLSVTYAELEGLMGEVHATTAAVFGALMALHIGAALRHLARRDGLFARMWPSVERG